MWLICWKRWKMNWNIKKKNSIELPKNIARNVLKSDRCVKNFLYNSQIAKYYPN